MDIPTYVTFDCYDTLMAFPIDQVTRQILGPRLDAIDVAAFLQAFEDLRYQAILGPYLPYRDVLGDSLAETMRRFGLPYDAADGQALVAASSTFGPFPEVPGVLNHLRQHCKIAIISNSDDAIIAANVRNIGVPFDRVITAEQARAYKPAPTVFDYALRELGCEARQILHVAQGFEYDIVPANALGWERVWINRYGKTGDPIYGPYHELTDLSSLPALIGI